jgi:probable HAF family extracellular repeat protein
MIRTRIPTVALIALSALVAATASASFTPLGVVDGLKVNRSSADGVYIVGQYLDANDDKIAIRWDITGSDPPEELGELPTGAIESEARAASGDGSVVVGDSKIEDPNDPTRDVKEAFLWEDDVMTGLGFLQDDTSKVESAATATSYDGTTVVGTSKVDDPNDPTKSVKEAFIWTAESNLMRSLRDVLEEELGIDLSKWTLDKPPVISSDGTTVIALATNPDGDVEAFVSYVPEPTGGVYPGIALLVWLDRRRSAKLRRAAAAAR